MSLGGGRFEANCDGSSALTEIVERLKAKGVAVVAAAGNDGLYDALAEPACISSIVSVSAERKTGEIDSDYSNVAKFATIAALGTGIVLTVPANGYKALSGTSIASPHVAASFAVLRLTQLLRRLLNGAPMTSDGRTGTRVPSLDLGRTTPVAASLSTTDGPVSSTSQGPGSVATPGASATGPENDPHLGECAGSVCFRPVVPIAVQISGTMLNPGIKSTFVAVVPDVRTVASDNVTRGACIERNNTLTFDAGVLTKAELKKPSEVLACLEIPLAIAKAVASVPGQTLTLRVQQATGEASLLQQERNVILAQQALVQAQAINR